MVTDKKLKVISVSLLNTRNFGTIMQNYATNKYLNQIGYNSQLLNYRCLFDIYLSTNSQILRNLVVKAFLIGREIRLERFLRKNVKLTKRYVTYKRLREAPPHADIYLVGSDQVWNPMFGNEVCKLGWVTRGAKMSYSSSIGEAKLDDDHLNELTHALRSFSAISVREDSGVTLLESAGINNVEHVMDPVFLLDRIDYDHLLKPNKNGRYILILSYERIKDVATLVKKIREPETKIIELGNIGAKYKEVSDTFYRNIGIEKILSLINNAEMVITTSFHATAFCIIFNKPFFVVKNKVATSRLTSLLNKIGLTDRMIFDADNVEDEILNAKIDWDKVNKSLSSVVEQSKKWLQDALRKCEEELQNEQLS